MKNTKKITALILAIIMMCSLSMGAFASAPGYASIEIYVMGELYFGENGYDDALEVVVGNHTTVYDAMEQWSDVLETE